MRTTVEIPMPIYRQLKAKAALEGLSVKEVILHCARRELQLEPSGRRVKCPIINGKEKRKLNLANTQINEILFGRRKCLPGVCRRLRRRVGRGTTISRLWPSDFDSMVRPPATA